MASARILVSFLTMVVSSCASSASFAGQVTLDQEASILAVVTHKGGLAASKAHNHLVAATRYRAKLDFDPASPLDATFELEVATEDLAVDRRDLQQAWYPRLAELGILDEPWSEVSEKDRAKIREAMLSKKQLEVAAFPKISARAHGIAPKPSTVGGVPFSHEVTLALEVRGETVEKPVAARWETAGDAVTVEAVGTFLFTDFGIKPYSAALGLVKNLDEFHVYVHLKTDGAE